MLAHTMDRCVLAVEHSFDCGMMRMHWKLQSVRPTPTTSTATQESTAVSGTKSKCLLVLQCTCGTRHDLHLCEHRQLSTLKSHRPSDVCHIKSAAQRTTERDAVFWFVPQQTGGTAHRRERGGFPVCTATNWWCCPAISDILKGKISIQLQEKNRERKKNLPPLQHTHHKHTFTAHAPAHNCFLYGCMPSPPAKCGRSRRLGRIRVHMYG